MKKTEAILSSILTVVIISALVAVAHCQVARQNTDNTFSAGKTQSFLGVVDFSSSTGVAPCRTGSGAPTGQNGTRGQCYYQTGATAGHNLWWATTTGTPATWTLQANSGGTVTTVGFTGGLLSVANPTTTPAFTVAGTSGGIPYFSSSSTWASSGALGSGQFVLGGGAGSTPTTSFSIVPGANGGTGNGFFAIAGPASTLKTHTWPNSSIDWTALTGVLKMSTGTPSVVTGTSTNSVLVDGTSAFYGTTYGAWASLPGTCSTGATYKASDSPYVAICTATNVWTKTVFGYTITEPVLGDFTQVNVGLSTFDTTHGGFIQSETSAGGNNVQVLTQAIPGSGAYYVDAAFINESNSTNGISGVGISAGNSTSDKLSFVGQGWESSSIWYVQNQYFSDITTHGANNGGKQIVLTGPLIWVRMYDDRTTNRTFYVSSNGYVWFQVYQEARTTNFTPAKAILASSPNAGVQIIHWVHFKIWQ